MEGFFFATSSGGAAAPNLTRSREARFNVGGVEGVVAGRGILESEDSEVFEANVDGVCRFCPLAQVILGGPAKVKRNFDSHTAICFV